MPSTWSWVSKQSPDVYKRQVHGHVVHFAQGDADQLALGVVFLEMQTAQHALGGTAPVSYTHLDVYKRQ